MEAKSAEKEKAGDAKEETDKTSETTASDKKKPEEDEVTDEQLEDVAGGARVGAGGVATTGCGGSDKPKEEPPTKDPAP